MLYVEQHDESERASDRTATEGPNRRLLASIATHDDLWLDHRPERLRYDFFIGLETRLLAFIATVECQSTP